MRKNLIIIALAIVVGLGLGYFIFRDTKPKEIIVEKVIENTQRIDSLNLIIKENENLIETLKDSVREKIIYVEKQIEEIKELPIDENLMVFRDNLLVYGENFNVTDTLPSLCQIEDVSDTLVLMSEENLIDVNTILVKYEGTLFINDCLYETVKADSSIISLKNSIIQEKDEALDRQRIVFEDNMREMNSIIARERRKQIYYTIGGVLVAGTITYLIMKQ